MSSTRIAPIVEGHGEVEAFPILPRRIGLSIAPNEHVDILRPVRLSRSKLLRRTSDDQVVIDTAECQRAVALAAKKLEHGEPAQASFVLMLLDADRDCPAQVVPELQNVARGTDSRVDVACVLANIEYETWFVAGADSLRDYLRIDMESIPLHPEASRTGKKWIEQRTIRNKYSETVDQPKLSAMMNLERCRERSPSFDKLWREIERRIRNESA